MFGGINFVPILLRLCFFGYGLFVFILKKMDKEFQRFGLNEANENWTGILANSWRLGLVNWLANHSYY